MPDQPFKTHQRQKASAPGRPSSQVGNLPSRGAGGSLASLQPAQAFLNLGPKLGLMLLVFAILAGYTGLVHGLLPQKPTPPGIASLPPQGTDAASQSGQAAQQAGGQQGAGEQSGQTAQSGQASQSGQSGQERPEVDGGAQTAQAPDEAALAAHREKLARYANNPRLFNNKETNGEDLGGLVLQRSTVSNAVFASLSLEKAHFNSMTFKGCTFKNVDFSAIDLREVMFENCAFEDSNFDGANLFQVVFKDSAFTNTGAERGLSKMRFAISKITNVSFENVSHDGLQFYQVGGRFTFKDTDLSGMRIFSHASQQYLNGRDAPKNLNITLDNCSGGEFDFEAQGMDSSVKITKADFEQGRISGFGKIQVSDSKLSHSTSLNVTDWIVVKNSDICADLTAWKGIYLVNNTYSRERSSRTENSFLRGEEAVQRVSKIRMKEGALGIIEGGTDGAWFSTNGGQLWISDLQVDFVYFELDHSGGMSTLNLKNVAIKSGHIWNSELIGGYWENVSIAKTMSSRNTRHEAVKRILASNVTLPDEGPWIEGDKFELVPTPRKEWIKYQVPELR